MRKLSTNQAMIVSALIGGRRTNPAFWERKFRRGADTIAHMIRNRIVVKVIEGERVRLVLTPEGKKRWKDHELLRNQWSRTRGW
jgi:hypothetical protein